jgi:hypothetical protein
MVRYGFCPPITISTPTREVLCFVFAPPDPSRLDFFVLFTFLISIYGSSSNVRVFPDSHTKSPYDPWGELASKLDDEQFRAEYVHLTT